MLDNQLQGNWGEQFIAEQLSAHHCYVRQVNQGQDSGIDLYCEKLSSDLNSNRYTPFLHFWCQIKTRKKLKGRNSIISFPYTAERNKIDYWLKQPVPVFIFVVPDLRQSEKKSPYYIFMAFDFYPNNNSIKSAYRINSDYPLNKFLENDLVSETYKWELMNGKVSALKYPNFKYSIEFPKGESCEFEGKLIESLRWTLRILSDDILFQNSNDDKILNKKTLDIQEMENLNKGKIYKNMLEMLATNKTDKHYDTYEIIGIYYELEKDFETALTNYLESQKILSEDIYIDKDSESWKDVINRIDNHIQRISDKKNKSKIYKSTYSNNTAGTIATTGKHNT